MAIVSRILIALAVLAAVAWLGLQVPPFSFEPYPSETPELKTTALPDDLPDPVDRFYRAVYGDEIPVIGSAVISGKARMRVFGISFPARFRFTHVAGQDYRHSIEAGLLGLPLMKVNEHYLDGKSRLELPFDVIENEPKIDQAANLGLWGESVWLPALFITDPRVRWRPIDDMTARLVVPFGDAEEIFVARFDPQTGMLRFLEAMRYKDAADEAKTLWINEARECQDLNGIPAATVGAVTWFDEGTPWAVFTVEELVYNADVSEYVRETGP